MKRQTEAQRIRQRQRRKAWLDRLARRRILVRHRNWRQYLYERRLIETTRVLAPVLFQLETDADRLAVVQFLAELRQHMLTEPRRRVMIDFSTTRRMNAAATLLFAAELSRINTLTPRRATCNYPPEDRIAQILQHVGIFSMLNQRKTCRVTRNDVRYWTVDSGSGVLGQRVARSLQRYSHHFTDPQRRRMYRALTEAQTNCKQHAYVEARGDGHANVENWWMFSQYLERHLSVAFCDLGMGIPRSLPSRQDLWKRIRRLIFFSGWSDDDASRIQAAMRIGASRTNKEYRGKGLNDIRTALDGLNGRLHIHSNSGFYTYDAATKAETCKNFGPTNSILGTVVLWHLPVEGSP